MTSSNPADLNTFLDAIHDFSTIPRIAIEQQPDRVQTFLERIGGISVLLGALGTPIEDDIVRDEIARCFRSVLATSSGRLALTSYPSIAQALLSGLHHSDEFVRQIAAEQLLGLYVQQQDGGGSGGIRDRLRAVLAARDVYEGVLDALSDPSTSVAENVSDLLVQIGDTERWFIQDGGIRARIRRITEQDDGGTALVRVLTLSARMGNLSEMAFRQFQESGVLSDLMEILMCSNVDVGGGDPLLQMSMFGVLTEMSHSKSGLQYLIQVPLGALLHRFRPGAVDTFVTCAALNVLDPIVDQSIQFDMFAWLQDPDLRTFLTSGLDSPDEAVLEPAIGAMAAVGKCYVGLCEFTRDQHDLLFRLPRIALRPALSTNALIIAVLHGLATLFAARTKEHRQEQARTDALHAAIIRGTPQDDRAEGVEHALRFMTKVKKWCCNVENDLRVATYRFLSEFGKSRFGLEAIISAPGLIETLLDRHLEHESKANLWRFSVVQALSTNPSLDQLASGTPGLAQNIRQHVHEGPFHKGTSIDVAVL